MWLLAVNLFCLVVFCFGRLFITASNSLCITAVYCIHFIVQYINLYKFSASSQYTFGSPYTYRNLLLSSRFSNIWKWKILNYSLMIPYISVYHLLYLVLLL
jgi:hypothetical protein